MTDTRDALMRAILVDPADDVARLVIADHYEESGEGDRAEFIRLQIAMAEEDKISRRADNCRCDGGGGICGACADERDWNAMVKREIILWPAVRPSFGYDPIVSFWCGSAASDAEILPLGIVRRGFVSAIRCRLADWVGAECETCGGDGWEKEDEADDDDFATVIGDCPDCVKGRTPAHGPRIVAEQPVETLALSDCKPDPGSGDIWYFAEEWIAMMPDAVADEVDDLCWSESELAEGFLGRALLKWARREAGLPPIPHPADAREGDETR